MDAPQARGAEQEVRDDAKVCGLDSLATSCAVNKDGEARRGTWEKRMRPALHDRSPGAAHLPGTPCVSLVFCSILHSGV